MVKVSKLLKYNRISFSRMIFKKISLFFIKCPKLIIILYSSVDRYVKFTRFFDQSKSKIPFIIDFPKVKE